MPRLRLGIAALLTGAAILNYVDRQTLSVLAPTIQADLGMDDRDYANVVNLFLIAYTLASLLSGRLVDRIGTRASMSLFVIGWSLANMLSALAQGPRSLGVSRFALGLGGAGMWPAASKAVSEWFPARGRAVVIGAYTTGATLGAAIAPYAVIPLASVAYAEVWPSLAQWLGPGSGWRIAFIVTGLAGFLLLIPWLRLYRLPRVCPLPDEPMREVSAPDAPTWGWRQVLCFKGLWLLLAGRLLTDPVWFFSSSGSSSILVLIVSFHRRNSVSHGWSMRPPGWAVWRVAGFRAI
ncbi:MAG TPA: MFS transporter [Kiritimatiellia bacterium]|nr:MFS transporter [Kiritimatiellia bacterium]HRU70649.1 MFS transporter [Kiritimatiellia bacterium]